MNVGLLVLGVVLLALVVVDLLWTTLWVEGGAGPLTTRLMAWTWRLLRGISSRDSRRLTLAGPLVLVVSLAAWIVSLWAGWTLVFASAETALVDTVGARRVTLADAAYFTGYSLFTLGNGDLAPQSPPWQAATTLVSASGMLLITLSVTYLLSVLGAVTQKRSFASNVHGLGEGGADVLRASWDGEAFRGLDVPLNSLSEQLTTLTANHLAYPVLHYFYSEQPGQAPTVSVAVLDEALTLLRFGVPAEHRPDELRLRETRSSVESYLQTVGSAYIEPADRTPPDPSLSVVREAGIPTVPDGEFADSVAALGDRRRTLLGLVQSDAREWPAGQDSL